jgi:hypothetical protein
MDADQTVRKQLLALLQGGNAHMSYEQAVTDFPPAHYNSHPPNLPYSPWHLLEHLRLTQADILDFIQNPDYNSPAWPEGYWPPSDAQADEAAWEQTLAQFSKDLQALVDILSDPTMDLYKDLPHAPGYNILREILVVSDHNAYHIGEFAILRQVMGTWNDSGAKP